MLLCAKADRESKRPRTRDAGMSDDAARRREDDAGTSGRDDCVLMVKRLNEHAVVPARATPQAAGYDLASAQEESVVVAPHGKALIGTGLAMAVPPGHYGRIAPRSSLAWKNFIDVGAGVIDSDYRGEVKVLLYNHGPDAFAVARGDRIAQLVIERISLPDVVDVAGDLPDTARGAGGFGSTGTRT